MAGVARELTAGTPLVPVITHPMDQADFWPEDIPEVPGRQGDPRQHDGPVLQDSRRRVGHVQLRRPQLPRQPRLLLRQRVRGPVDHRASIGNPATFNSALAVGATSGTLLGRPCGPRTRRAATIQIGTGATTEVVIIGSTAPSNIVNFASSAGGNGYPLRFTHPTGPTVSTCGTPFTHRWAALNQALGYGGARSRGGV